MERRESKLCGGVKKEREKDERRGEEKEGKIIDREEDQ